MSNKMLIPFIVTFIYCKFPLLSPTHQWTKLKMYVVLLVALNEIKHAVYPKIKKAQNSLFYAFQIITINCGPFFIRFKNTLISITVDDNHTIINIIYLITIILYNICTIPLYCILQFINRLY